MILGILWSVSARIFEPYHAQTFMGLALSFVFFSYIIGKRLTPLFGVAFSYFSLHALWMTVYPHIRWNGYNLSETVAFQSQVTESLLFLTGIVLFFVMVRGQGLGEKIHKFFLATAVCDVVILALRLFYGKEPYFLFNNPAIDTAFLGCMVPIFFNRKQGKFVIFAIVVVCLAAKTSSGVLACGLSLSLYHWAKKGFKFGAGVSGVLLCLWLSLVGLALQGPVLFNSSGRTWAWGVALKYWLGNLQAPQALGPQYTTLLGEKINHFFGAGLGTFQMYGPVIQLIDTASRGETQYPVFFWMHNDYLQILFETGAVGLVISLAVLTTSVYKARRSPAVFASIVSYAGIAFIQMPLRHFLFASLGAWLVCMSHLSSTTKCSPHKG